MVAITLENLTKRFGSVDALAQVSLAIHPGELFFLLGPSGCGKTTLLRSVAGFCLPEKGRIFFDREEVTSVPPHKRNTGLMFQNYALFPHLTVAKNVAFGLQERRVPAAESNQRVKAALESVQMEKHADRKIPELSGGQQQRVALARALVIRPRCLLLDEPLSNLDARLRIEMRSEIRRVCKEAGLTAIYVTHDQKEALSIADRMAILADGRIAQVGTPEEIYRSPGSRFVAEFLGECDFFEGSIRSLGEEAKATEGFSRRQATVETELGLFEGFISAPNWMPALGEKALLSIRPECWRLGKETAPLNAVAGKIGRSIYLGEVAQYRFSARTREIKIVELNPHPWSRQTGEEFQAHVHPRDVVVLPSQPGSPSEESR